MEKQAREAATFSPPKLRVFLPTRNNNAMLQAFSLFHLQAPFAEPPRLNCSNTKLENAPSLVGAESLGNANQAALVTQDHWFRFTATLLVALTPRAYN